MLTLRRRNFLIESEREFNEISDKENAKPILLSSRPEIFSFDLIIRFGFKLTVIITEWEKEKNYLTLLKNKELLKLNTGQKKRVV